MSKRRRGTDGRFKTSGGSLTGGTGDVKPQILTVGVPGAVGINDYSVVEFPVPRIIMGSVDSATIMEILTVWFYNGIIDMLDSNVTTNMFLSTTLVRTQDETCNLASMAADMVNATTLAIVFQHKGTTVSGSHVINQPMMVDLTDKNGNGVLVATDKLFVTSGVTANTLITTAVVKILYRMVNVGITEYVGIVQSQIV